MLDTTIFTTLVELSRWMILNGVRELRFWVEADKYIEYEKCINEMGIAASVPGVKPVEDQLMVILDGRLITIKKADA